MSSTKKIASWVLLLLGLAIIFYSLYSSFNIFTAKSPAPEIFAVVAETPLSQEGGLGTEGQLQEMIGQQLKGMIPADTLPKILNLTVWSMLVFILIFGGAQISSLGIKLMK